MAAGYGARGGPEREREHRVGRQRQVGRPLEDGPRRPSGVGESGRRQPARAAIPAADYTRRPMPDGLLLLEAGAADRLRARDLLSVAIQYGERVPAGLPGRGTEAGRLLRRTTTSSI